MRSPNTNFARNFSKHGVASGIESYLLFWETKFRFSAFAVQDSHFYRKRIFDFS